MFFLSYKIEPEYDFVVLHFNLLPFERKYGTPNGSPTFAVLKFCGHFPILTTYVVLVIESLHATYFWKRFSRHRLMSRIISHTVTFKKKGNSEVHIY